MKKISIIMTLTLFALSMSGCTYTRKTLQNPGQTTVQQKSKPIPEQKSMESQALLNKKKTTQEETRSSDLPKGNQENNKKSDKDPKKTSSSESETDNKKELGEDLVMISSLEELMNQKKSLKCLITKRLSEAENLKGEGIAYLAENNLFTKVDIPNSINEELITSYILIKNKEMITWNTAEPEGMFFDINKIKQSPENSNYNVVTQELSAEIELKCKDWKRNDSKFIIPENVVFIDMM